VIKAWLLKRRLRKQLNQHIAIIERALKDFLYSRDELLLHEINYTINLIKDAHL
jgi:hypothetical protein